MYVYLQLPMHSHGLGFFCVNMSTFLFLLCYQNPLEMCCKNMLLTKLFPSICWEEIRIFISHFGTVGSSLSVDPWKMGYWYQKEAIPLMKCIPPPGFRICFADICRAQLNWKYCGSGGAITYSAIYYDKLYISAVRQAYLDTTGLCWFNEGYAN